MRESFLPNIDFPTKLPLRIGTKELHGRIYTSAQIVLCNVSVSTHVVSFVFAFVGLFACIAVHSQLNCN